MKLYPDVRPYWHVDAKWICGILLLFVLSACLALAAATKITNQKRGPEIAALIVGKGFIRGDSINTEEAKAELDKQGGVIHPLPIMPSIVITQDDLKLSPQEISLKVFKPLTEAVYQNGIEGTANQFAPNPDEKTKFIKEAFFLRPFTKQTHDKLKNVLTVFAIISVMLAMGVIYFSAGWGRLSNLGFLLLLISLPGTFVSLLLLHPPKNGNGGFNSWPPLLSHDIGTAFSETYVRITLLGSALLIAALAGKIFQSVKGPSKPAAKPSEKSPSSKNK